MTRVPLEQRGPVDMHVHLVGNGLKGSGCWLKMGFGHRFLAGFMLRQLGLKTHYQHPDFDHDYVELLIRWLRESAITHAVLLAHEEVYHPDGRKRNYGSLHVPNDYLLTVCAAHPEFLPAVSIHPARPDALEALEHALEAGAVMMKCLPNCHDIDTRLPQYRKFWERMASAGLPLLAHTGGEHTLPVCAPHLADPATLTGALECGVKVIAAHCATRSGLRDPDYLPVLAAMMEQWPQLYGDISALNLPVRSGGLKYLLQRPHLHERLVHGSDFPVPVQSRWARMRGLISPAEDARCRGYSNLIARDHRLKEACGFPPETFTRIWDVLRVRE